jgi:hypothetical protein
MIPLQSTVKSVSPVSILFRSVSLPTGVTGLPGASITVTNTRYESSVSVTGGITGKFRGSIYPDNMNVKGHLLNGTYNVFLGFHKEGTPTQRDLQVRTNGFRAVLVINRGNPLHVESNRPAKTTSVGIHIHNGFNHWKAAHPMSEGCLILHPADWSKFITLFLTAFPNLADWSINGSRVGRQIGTVTVQAQRPMGDFPAATGKTAFA